VIFSKLKLLIVAVEKKKFTGTDGKANFLTMCVGTDGTSYIQVIKIRSL
jgi:hypothetical protein